jgi:hypothetical protein
MGRKIINRTVEEKKNARKETNRKSKLKTKT